MNVSMNDIARKIGIPVGSIYTYFPSKQALIETIIEEGWNQFRTWLEQQLAMIEDNLDDCAIGSA
jgi:AcrR family transcriptional regulator